MTDQQFEALFMLIFVVGLVICFALGVIGGQQR